MDYDLDHLDERNFEHVVQALAQAQIGAGLTVFGDGPDGGREATWTHTRESLRGEPLNSYGVLQAKHRLEPSSRPTKNFEWLLAQVGKDVKRWSVAKSKRRSPEIYLVATNVKLGSGAGAGKDQVGASVIGLFRKIGIDLLHCVVWDRDDLRALLDNNPAVRSRYDAWLTPGDVISQVIANFRASDDDFATAIELHAASMLKREANLKLTQTGSVRDDSLEINDVFIDLPTQERNQFTSGRASNSKGAAKLIIENANKAGLSQGREESRTTVLVGGPGQGKSTVTQFIAQLYRTYFLPGDDRQDLETARLAESTLKRMRDIGLTEPIGKRWPVRITLPDFADSLADRESTSLIDFITLDISSRSGIGVTQSQTRAWLDRAPWLLILDGFDEVPESANRAQVLGALSTFQSLAETRSANVVTVTTTRPQGYNDEFGFARHLKLAPLPAGIATDYGNLFLDVRNGPDYPDNERTKRLLRSAITSETSARLSETPLQVTILAVLLEKLGHAPANKWALFSNYYSVILQREQEKPGTLAALLQKHAPQIAYIHRYTGMILQERAAGSGSATSTLSRDEFQQIVEARLLQIGYESGEAAALAKSFMRLATVRLVFISMLTANTVGFELRSFQEFMAAEQIVLDRSESDTLARLRQISADPYWRNTFLFAAGNIFANRDVLKPAIVLLASELDEQDEVGHLEGRGRTLALDILDDDLCVSEPLYARPLAKQAAQILNSTLSRQAARLARLRDSTATSLIKAEARQKPSTLDGLVGRATFISNNARTSESDQLVEATALFESARFDGRRTLLQWAWRNPDSVWEEVASRVVGDFNPFSLARSSRRGFEDGPDEVKNSWTALTQLAAYEPSIDSNLSIRGPVSGELLYNGSIDAIKGREAAWAQIRETASSEPGWRALGAVSKFVQDPTPATLADTLEYSEFLSSPGPLRLPWVVEWANVTVEETSPEGRENFRALVRSGAFGAFDEWLAAEFAFSETISSYEDLIKAQLGKSRGDQWGAPPLSAISLAAAVPDSPERALMAVEQILQVAPVVSRLQSPSERVTASSNLLFALSTAVADGPLGGSPLPGSSRTLRELLLKHADALVILLRETASLGLFTTWAEWLAAFDGSQAAYNLPRSIFEYLGSSGRITVGDDRGIGKALLDRAALLGCSADEAAFILIVDPSRHAEIDQLISTGKIPVDPDSRIGSLLRLLRGDRVFDVDSGLHGKSLTKFLRFALNAADGLASDRESIVLLTRGLLEIVPEGDYFMRQEVVQAIVGAVDHRTAGYHALN